MRISIFLSHPKPFNDEQEEFIQTLRAYMIDNGLEPRTLGVTDYDPDVPLKAIRRLMMESNGIVTIAFRRTFIQTGSSKPGHSGEYCLDGKWLTSPYSQIEPAMAYQIGLPSLILREDGVVPEGILEKGVTGYYLPVFNLNKNPDSYFKSEEWVQLFKKWEGNVNRVQEKKGDPPKMY